MPLRKIFPYERSYGSGGIGEKEICPMEKKLYLTALRFFTDGKLVGFMTKRFFQRMMSSMKGGILSRAQSSRRGSGKGKKSAVLHLRKTSWQHAGYAATQDMLAILF